MKYIITLISLFFVIFMWSLSFKEEYLYEEKSIKNDNKIVFNHEKNTSIDFEKNALVEHIVKRNTYKKELPEGEKNIINYDINGEDQVLNLSKLLMKNENIIFDKVDKKQIISFFGEEGVINMYVSYLNNKVYSISFFSDEKNEIISSESPTKIIYKFPELSYNDIYLNLLEEKNDLLPSSSVLYYIDSPSVIFYIFKDSYGNNYFYSIRDKKLINLTEAKELFKKSTGFAKHIYSINPDGTLSVDYDYAGIFLSQIEIFEIKKNIPILNKKILSGDLVINTVCLCVLDQLRIFCVPHKTLKIQEGRAFTT